MNCPNCNKANRESGGRALTTEETRRYEELTALAGQMDLLAEDQSSAVRGRIKNLIQKKEDLLREMGLQMKRIQKSRDLDVEDQLREGARQYQQQIIAVEKEISKLEESLVPKVPGAPAPPPTPPEEDLFNQPPKPVTPAPFGSKNTIITTAKADELRQRIKDKLDQSKKMGIKPGKGLDPTIFSDAVQLGACTTSKAAFTALPTGRRRCWKILAT